MKQNIEEKLFNTGINLNERDNIHNLNEQYKLIIETTAKSEDRRIASNNFFITINSLFLSFMSQLVPFAEVKKEKFYLLLILLPIGVFVCWDWLKVINTYQRVNFVNYTIISILEKFMPTYLFTIRTNMISGCDNPYDRANKITKKEKLIPQLFLSIYLAYALVALAFIFYL